MKYLRCSVCFLEGNLTNAPFFAVFPNKAVRVRFRWLVLRYTRNYNYCFDWIVWTFMDLKNIITKFILYKHCVVMLCSPGCIRLRTAHQARSLVASYSNCLSSRLLDQHLHQLSLRVWWGNFEIKLEHTLCQYFLEFTFWAIYINLSPK